MYFSSMCFSLLPSTAVLMCIGLVNAQTFTTSTGTTIGLVAGILSAVAALIGFALCCLRIYLVQKRSQTLRSHALAQPATHPPLTTGSHVIYSLDQPPTVNSSSEATTGVPHSTIPLESELQNAPPPAYSTAYQYPVYTQPDEATSQNTFHGEEPIAEPPPSYPE